MLAKMELRDVGSYSPPSFFLAEIRYSPSSMLRVPGSISSIGLSSCCPCSHFYRVATSLLFFFTVSGFFFNLCSLSVSAHDSSQSGGRLRRFLAQNRPKNS